MGDSSFQPNRGVHGNTTASAKKSTGTQTEAVKRIYHQKQREIKQQCSQLEKIRNGMQLSGETIGPPTTNSLSLIVQKQTLTTPEDKANAAADFYTDLFANENTTDNRRHNEILESLTGQHQQRLQTCRETNSTKLPKRKSTGANGIPNEAPRCLR